MNLCPTNMNYTQLCHFSKTPKLPTYLPNYIQQSQSYIIHQQNLSQFHDIPTPMTERPIVQLDKLKLEGISEVVTSLSFILISTLAASQNDYQYDYYGNRIAVSDSVGNVFVYARDTASVPNNNNPNSQGKFKLHSTFKGADSSIWRLAWSHPRFGDLVAIGSFTKKVSVFQLKPNSNEWIEVAYHSLHEGSVNEVHWAPEAYGLKLYACSSDGTFSVLEVVNGQWNARLFQGHELSINSMSIQKPSLLSDYVIAQIQHNTEICRFSQKNLQKQYPNIVTGSKDRSIGVWKYNYDTREYQRIFSYIVHKEAIRNVLWRQSAHQHPEGAFQVFTCSEVYYINLIVAQDGTVKVLDINPKQNGTVTETVLMEETYPVLKLSQSSTGNFLVASVEEKGVNRSTTFNDIEGQWHAIDNYSA